MKMSLISLHFLGIAGQNDSTSWNVFSAMNQPIKPGKHGNTTSLIHHRGGTSGSHSEVWLSCCFKSSCAASYHITSSLCLHIVKPCRSGWGQTNNIFIGLFQVLFKEKQSLNQRNNSNCDLQILPVFLLKVHLLCCFFHVSTEAQKHPYTPPTNLLK